MRPGVAPALLFTTTLLGVASSSPECAQIRDQNTRWDIRPLKGRQEVWEKDAEDPADAKNTTYAFDLCSTLGSHREKGEEGCKGHSWVCAFEHKYDPETKKTDPDIHSAWSIAGNFHASGKGSGGELDDHYERLKGSNANAEGEEEGVRLLYHGGYHNEYHTRFIATLICDKDKQQALRKRQQAWPVFNLFSRSAESKDDDDDEGESDDPSKPDDGSRPKFESYKVEPIPGTKGKDNMWTLRIRWKTLYACEDQAGKDNGSGGGHWGFFTWFIIILFLAIAAYLIFGSWLNYNRHGARGWDLLPHGDTIRDVPYLLKDWARAIVDTVQGTHTRGGYNQI